jgi:hypothetical protein
LVGELRSGQEVWVGRRRAIFLYTQSADAAIVRFAGERETRVVPMSKLQRGSSEGVEASSSESEPPTAA